MLTQSARLRYLLEQYAADNCTKKELLELLQAIDDARHDEELQDSLEAIWKGISETDSLPVLDKEKIFSNIISTAPVHILPRRKFIRWRVAAAAIFILVSGGFAYLYFTTQSTRKIAGLHQNNLKNDRAPGGNKAILTLADGSNIVLDSARNGALTQQGNTAVIKMNNGQLAYEAALGDKLQAASAATYNTIATPRGGQYQVVLPDGTKVWLNAASSLKFPTTFTGKERDVELTGEAYFEVAKNAGVPFKVHIISHQMPESGKGSSGGQGAGEEIGRAHV